MPIAINEIIVIRQKDNLFITLSGDGASDILCLGARVREGFSTISEMRMEFVSTNTGFDPRSILGKRITVLTAQEFKFSSIVVSVEDVGLMAGGDVYAAELRPWLWMTTIGEENRVYQGKTAPVQPHRLLSLNAVRLFECAQVEPPHPFRTIFDDLPTIVDEAVYSEGFCAVQVWFKLVHHRRIGWHEHVAFQARTSGIRGCGTAGVSRCRQGDALHTEPLRHADCGRHPATFERPGWQLAFVLHPQLRQPELAAETRAIQ